MTDQGDSQEDGVGLSRRQVLQAGTAAAAGVVIGPRVTSASPSEDRYIVDMSTTTMGEMGDVEVVYDFRDYIEYVVVEGTESELPTSATYAADLDIEIDVPQQEAMDMDARDAEEPFYDLQWDKQEQDIEKVHEDATGSGTRIGIVDDGVLGAGNREIVAGLEGHPDLPNVRADLSANFTDDGEGPGPLNDDHGTHCAGTAAAAANGTGVVGMAPDAEIVDLRVFSGQGASFADITAAIIVGAVPEGVPVNVGTADEPEVYTGAGCDVLNLSLGTGPLPPTEGVLELTASQSAVAQFALDNGTLPVASAGNESTNLDDSPEGFDESFINLPSEADGFMSIGATGPIGFGWPAEDDSEEVAGIPFESPVDTELPTQEPAFYTNYGAEGVDVTAGGGNADIGAIGGPNYFIDLVFSTGIRNLDDQEPEDTVLDTYIPGYVFKAGTSFSAPNVAGFAALLFGLDPEATPEEVRATIEDTARSLPVGKAGETTAPGADVNVATDGTFDGDQPSNPGSAPGRFDSGTYRGEGHIDIPAAVERFASGEDGNGNAGGNGNGRGN